MRKVLDERKMPTREGAEIVKEAWLWSNTMLWSVVTMFLLGSMARTFISKEPFDLKNFLGEMIFSAIGAVMMFSMGLMQGMSDVQIMCFGAGAALGGVRLFEWFMKIAKAARESAGGFE